MSGRKRVRRGGVLSRSKCSKIKSPSPEREFGSSVSTEEVNHENATSRRATRSQSCGQALYPSSETEGVVPSVKYGLPTEDDDERTLVIRDDNAQSSTRQSGRRKVSLKRKLEMSGTSVETGSQQKEGQEEDEDEGEVQPDVEIDQELDRELESKSRQHKLTSANVRSIIHEVITNEHVVAMMKAAINDTEPVPLFEPKMTRSKLKEVVEKGVVIPTWNISPIKKSSKEKGPQFVDIPLEEEDSSDEEYCPDEEEEDETAEDTVLESDLESTASSPRGTRISLNRSYSEYNGDSNCSPIQSLRKVRHLRVESVPMGPPPPPQGPDTTGPSRECSFMEKLHAVDEELAIGSYCMDTYQPLSSTGEDSMMAFRTRSKRPLRDVPLGRLEAELRAPDITPDMYEHGSATEDVVWTQWLQGLMSADVENEEEGDDDDDPEYNFLADIDEPDVEDYRNDKAVRITKKEVNDLMEELFDAFQDELGGPDEEGHEEEEEKEEESAQQEPPSVLETIQFEDPLADILKQRYRTVKEKLAAIRKRKALLESKGITLPSPPPKRPTSPTGPLVLSPAQKLHLQQHIQQHVQLLTQVNMLSRSVKNLQTESSTARQFLLELHFLAQQKEQAQSERDPAFVSIFRACNLQTALSLLEELDHFPKTAILGHGPLFLGSQIPAHLAWLMATRPVFLYPELLPEADLVTFHYKGPFTSAENCLVVLGYEHFQDTVHPLQLTSRYLLVARNCVCLRAHIRNACQKQSPNLLKDYFLDDKYPSMPLACKRVSPGDLRPPVEKEKHLMPYWLSENLKLIYEEVRKYNQPLDNSQPASPEYTPSYTFPPGTRYPPYLPETLALLLKPPPPLSYRRKISAELSAQACIQPREPSPPPKSVAEALSRLPPILPKTACPSVQKTVHSDQLNQALDLTMTRLQINPPSPGTAHVENSGQNQLTNAADQIQGKLILTLPTVPVDTPSHASETCITVSSTSEVAQADSREENVNTLPTAPGSTSLNPVSLGAVTVTSRETHTTGSSNAKIAPPGPNQGNVIILPSASITAAFICPTSTTKVTTQTPGSFTPLARDHMSQRCGTLLKLSAGQRTPLSMNFSKPLSQNTLHQFLVLPPGCIVTSCQNTKPNHIDNTQNPSLAQEMTKVGEVAQNSSLNACKSSHACTTVPQDMSSNEDLESNHKDNSLEEPEEEELDVDEMVTHVEEQEECSEEEFRKPFLTLSESSGSSTPSLSGDDVAMETMLDEEVKEQREHQETMQELSWPTSEAGPDDKGLAAEVRSDASASVEGLLNDDIYDDDPLCDIKDVAFAQAYLEKVCEVLQAVPGKVEDFLAVLYEFEQDPEGKTSVDLFMRLKPVLRDWPDLLRDFAAFLHPEQAQECGLLAEQQAFARSRCFMRQLERTFGEHTAHYRRVVRMLQLGPSKTLTGTQEMKAQIAMLFRNHTHLQKEFWVFFEKLHSTTQCQGDDGEEAEEEVDCDDSDSVSSVQSMQSMDENQQCQPVEAHSSKRIAVITQNIKMCGTGAEMENECSGDRDVQSLQTASESPVCAKNSSRMPSGEKVVLWTREADRVILTTCQKKGASQSTFSSIAAELHNKTASEVGARYRDLIKLFHLSTKRHTGQLVTESSYEEEPD